MFKIAKEDGVVVVIEAEGKIGADDYDVLVPAVEKTVKEQGYANLVLVTKGLKGETLGGIKNDAKFAFSEYNNVKKFALVTDQDWLRAGLKIMAPFTRTEEKIFDLDQQDEAEAWAKA